MLLERTLTIGDVEIAVWRADFDPYTPTLLVGTEGCARPSAVNYGKGAVLKSKAEARALAAALNELAELLPP